MRVNTTEPSSEPVGTRAGLIAVLLAIGIWAFASFLTTQSTLFDRDEPRFAQATVEMIHSGNWLYPTFDGEVRADKPILVYWLMALPMRVFGASAWSARFWSPVCLALSALLAFVVARRLFDARTGWLAMLMLGMAPLALLEGTVATTDALLLLCITAALASLALSIRDGQRSWHVALIAAAFSAGLLAKGPVGLAIPLLSIGLALWLLRKEHVLGARFALGILIASLAAVGVFLAWGIPANEATGGEFLRRGIGHHVVERMATPLESHGGSFLISLPYYVPVVLIGFLPGLLYLPAAISAVMGGRLGGRRASVLLAAWTLPCFVLMTIVSTKLPHYVLPIWPGLAIACAAVVMAAERGELDERDRRWLRRGAMFLAVPGFVMVAGLVAAPSFVKLDGVRIPSLVMAALLAITFTFVLVEHVRGRIRRGAHVLVGGLAVSWAAGALLALPLVERTKVAPAIAVAVRTLTPADVQVARWKFVEPSLDFYLDRPPIVDFEDEVALRAFAQASTPAVLVIPRDRLEALRDVLPAAIWTEIASARGFNLSKGKPLELVAIGRNLPARPQR